MLNQIEKKSESIIDKKIKYEEQDIIIDPRMKSEDILTYFKKNEIKDIKLAKDLKLKTNKIFDQDFDIDKCELVDLDKKSNEKIINLIFKKKADSKYLDYLNTVTQQGFIVEDDEHIDLECNEIKKFKIKSPVKDKPKCN